MKKLGVIFTALALLFSLTAPAMAAETSGTATTLRLEKTEGTVTTKNASGKTVTSREGTRLYSGYEISTAKKSYAYLSLDSTKAVKMDASSKGEVAKSGKKLELKLSSGKLFFDVSAPVKADESLKIRTSTMVTGVRGTAGWVEAVDRFTTRISLLEGELEINSIDPMTGKDRTTGLVGGQTVTVVFAGVGEGFDPSKTGSSQAIQELIDAGIIRGEHIILTGTGLTVEALQEEDVPGFVAVEVARDSELQKRIDGEGVLSVPEIIGDAEEKLAAEETAAEEMDQAIREALENMTAETVDPLFEEESEPAPDPDPYVPPAPVTYTLTVNRLDGTGNVLAEAEVQTLNAGDSYTTSALNIADYAYLRTEGDPASGTMDGNKVVNYIYLYTVTLTNPTTADLNAQLLNAGAREITATYDTPTTLAAGDVTVAAGQTLNISGTGAVTNNATITVAEGGTLNISNNFTNDAAGIIGGTGTINITGTMDNQGTLSTDSTNSLNISGILNNNNVINVGNETPGALNIRSGGVLNNQSMIYVGNTDFPEGAGTLTIEQGGTLNNSVSIYVGNGATGELTVSGTLNNNNNSSDIRVGRSDTKGAMTIGSGGRLVNDGTITLGAAADDDMIAAAGTLEVEAQGTVENNAHFYIESNGVLTVRSEGSFETVNSVSNSGRVELYGTLTASYCNHALEINGGDVLISGGTLKNTYSDTGYRDVAGVEGSGFYLGDGLDADGNPVSIIIEGNSIIETTGDTFYAIANQSGARSYGFRIEISDSTITAGTNVIIDGNMLDTTTDDETEETIGTTIHITDSTVNGEIKGTDADTGTLTATQNNVTSETQTRYTVYFHNNDGDSFMLDENFELVNPAQDEVTGTTFTVGIDKILPTPDLVFEKTGYTFAGWSLTQGGEVKYTLEQLITEPITQNKAVILYAVWRADSYTIKFDANGGTGAAMSDMTFTLNDTTKTLTPNIFIREGYAFDGWSTNSNGESGGYADECKVTDISVSSGKSEITLYAVWAPIYTIVYHKNDDVEPEETKVETFTAYSEKTYTVLDSDTFTVEGEFFNTWVYGTEDSTKTLDSMRGADPEDLAIYDEADGTADHEIHIYAIWVTSYEYSVVFYPNDGTENFTCGLVNIPHDDEITLSADPWSDNPSYQGSGTPGDTAFSRNGYTLLGWNTEADGSGTFYALGAEAAGLSSDPSDKDVALYAVWTTNSYPVKLDANGGSGSMDDLVYTVGSDTGLVLPDSTFTPPNDSMEFAGWSESVNGAIITGPYIPSALPANPGDTITLYAQWKQKNG